MHRFVVVGGGIAGVVVATRLGRRLGRRAKAQIFLVDRTPANVWKPMLHTFASGTADYHDENVSFFDQASRSGFRYLLGDLVGVDRQRREVITGPVLLRDGVTELGGSRVPYDKLILAVGSHTNDFGTPGIGEHCHSIDDIRQAERFNASLRAKALSYARQGRDLRVAIVGGGATGVELAAELSRAKDIVAGFATEGLSATLRLALIESGGRLLAALPDRVSDAAEAKLRQLGVEIELNAKVTSADASGFILNGGRRIGADLMVWAAGIKAPESLATIKGLTMTRNGQLAVRATLQTTEDESIFAIGDCSSLKGEDGNLVPATAQAARQQAVFLAGSLINSVLFNRPLREFRYRDFGSVVSLGGYAAYGTLGRHGIFDGGFIQGRVAQLGHAALYRAHQLDLEGKLRGGMLWLADDLRRLARPGVRLD